MFRKILKKSNFMNMFHVGAEMLHGDRRNTDGQTDMKDLIVAFRNFANTRKGKSKQDKAIPLQAWTGPEGSRSLRLPDFKTVGT